MRWFKDRHKGEARRNEAGRNKVVKLYGVSGLLALSIALGTSGTDPAVQPGAGLFLTAAERQTLAAEAVQTGALEEYANFYVVDGCGYAKFDGLSKLTEAVYAGALNAYADNLPEDVKLYSMLAPTSAAFTLPTQYAGLFPDQRQIIADVAGMLDERFISIDIYPTLEAHKNEYLYFRTDHHWTQRAGYLAYTQLAGPLKFPAYSDKKLNQCDTGIDFLGSVAAETGSRQLGQNLDRLSYYPIPADVNYVYWDNTAAPHTYSQGLYKWWYLSQPNKYVFFLGGDLPYIRLKTDAQSGRKIAVIKDSYANTVIPFLTLHFDEIHIIDPRNSSFNALQIIEENDIKEVLFVNYARVVCLPKFSAGLHQLLTRDYVTWR